MTEPCGPDYSADEQALNYALTGITPEFAELAAQWHAAFCEHLSKRGMRVHGSYEAAVAAYRADPRVVAYRAADDRRQQWLRDTPLAQRLEAVRQPA